MNNFVGVKLIKAEPQVKDGKNGYRVIYPDGYESWSPKETFESAYFPIDCGSRITQEDVNRFIDMSEITVTDADAKTTLVRIEMPTGFVEYEASSCVCPENYNREMGKEIGIEHISCRIWKMLGFVLQWGKDGLK